ncbi:endoribonuclease rege-1 isoform X2 [Teleopsis dalmanni]|uniref:endoribonuclease rege-1 isoform X2 n=2 Tax=Teleopsis dalmanni TaxID=139649 RepID=UPI0018CCBFA1|nr:endoribonuclease rege-1 isoform X2 [Teleopsis dalmanni]XP_037954094.1 endoribonuclease rege-1 isoform X2 [Teleopsis dalmanni]
MNRTLKRNAMQNAREVEWKHKKQRIKDKIDLTAEITASKVNKPTISVRKNLIIASNCKENIIDDDCICVEPELVSIDLENYEPSNFLSSTPISQKEGSEVKKESNFFEEKKPKWWIDTTGDKTLTSINSPDKVTPPKHSTKNSTAKSHFRPEDIIVLDETFEDTTLKPKTVNDDSDDSVLFVSDSKSPDYIPLNSTNTDNTSNSSQYVINCIRAKMVRNNSLFTKSEKKKLMQYNTNAYNPGTVEILRKRMIIIDGSNVAYSHSRNKEFSVRGLKICLDYFENMGHRVKAVVPQFRLQKSKSSDPASLEKYYENGKIVFTPCKNLPGMASNSYDDRFILQLAAEQDAVIISNDNYRDLIDENIAFKKLIENRVLGYTWCDDIFMLPKDPYGRFGPTLDSILNRKI